MNFFLFKNNLYNIYTLTLAGSFSNAIKILNGIKPVRICDSVKKSSLLLTVVMDAVILFLESTLYWFEHNCLPWMKNYNINIKGMD
jgi:hypothetical protein